MKRCCYLLVTSVFLMIPIANATSAPKEIEVFGEAIIQTDFDLLMVNILVSKEGRSIEKQMISVNDSTKHVLSLAKQYQINDNDIQVNNIKINKKEVVNQPNIQGIEVNDDFSQRKMQHKNNTSVYIGGNNLNNNNINQAIDTFVATRTVIINVTNIKRYGDFLSQAMKSRNTYLFTYNASSKFTNEYQQKALEKAIVNAKNKAKKIALQTGASLGDLKQLKELDTSNSANNLDGALDRCINSTNQQNYSSPHSTNHNQLTPNALGIMPMCFKAKVTIKYNLQ